MKCPFCKADDTAVIDSRLSEDAASVRRRRQCKECGKRFTTYERVELAMPTVIKSNGYRTAYDREKIRTGFMRALHKRPVPTDNVDDAINRVEARILALGERETTSLGPGAASIHDRSFAWKPMGTPAEAEAEDFQRVD